MSLELLMQFHFIRPAWLILLLPFSFFIYLNWQESIKQQQWLRVLPAHLANVLKVGETGWNKQLPLKLLLVTCIVVVIILAGPTWRKEASPFGEDAANLVVVLDVSESMLERDVAPSRLERAKHKISDVIEQRRAGQTGLVVYSGSAHIAMPLTKDKKVFDPLLNSMSPKVMPRDGKFAQYSVALVNKMLRDSKTPGTVLLLTDGVNESTYQVFEDYFADSIHQLLILGMGNEKNPGTIPYEASTLDELASRSDGHFKTVTVDNEDVEWVLNRVESNLLISADNVMPWKDSGYYLVFLVSLAYLFWFRKGWLVKWCLVVTVGSLSMQPNQAQAANWKFVDLWLTADQQGQMLFNNEEYAEAAVTFESSAWKAASYYMYGNYKLAQSYFLRTDSLEAKFGAAAALAHQREYVAARKMYQEIVDADPDFPGAQYNLDVIQSIIDQINQFSESQTNNTERQNSRELGEQPQTSEGVEEKVQQDQLIEETLTSEEILNDPAVNEKWMRRVETDLGHFLRAKFYYQLEDGIATEVYSSKAEQNNE